MNTFLKLSSVKTNKNCNCISPFYIDSISGLNPNTGRDYSNEDKNIIKTALYRISNAKGCDVSVCCDPNDPTKAPDAKFMDQFIQKYPKILPMYNGSNLKSIKLSTIMDVNGSGWIKPSPHMICKITKATISDTDVPTIKIATNLVNDCFTDNCSTDIITVNNLLQTSKVDMSYTYVDDARVSQAIAEKNISYVKEYIRMYKNINAPLTNNDYNNRMIHLAAESSSLEILNMLIALKANLNITNKIRETPMHFAVRSKRKDNIDALLIQGVDLTIATNKGETAMFYAMQTGDISIIKMLYNNNSPLLGIDKEGNNLIQYCILNCPTFEENDDTVSNTKSEIIRFLIEHGISSDQKNIKGLTPLEIVSKEINKEINKECGAKKDNDESIIKEKFFDIKSKPKPILESFHSQSNLPSNRTGAKTQDISGYTSEHISLLEIQTLLFNNIIRNNPDKYNKYISVKDIPKGAPIKVLDTVCVGENLSGNEDSDECKAAGGQIVKVKNATTKIKLNLIPEEETEIDNISQKDLYFDKYPNPIPNGTISSKIKTFNDNTIAKGPVSYTTTPNTGITYNIGESSTNLLNSVESGLGFNPKPTPQSSQSSQSSQASQASQSPNTTIAQTVATPTIAVNNPTTTRSQLHPPNLDDEDDFVHKCKIDAIKNSTSITESRTTQQSTTTQPNDILSSIKQNTTLYLVLTIVISLIILVLIYLGYKYINSQN